MDDVIVVLILLAIVAGILWYLFRAKKRGQTCIGCPYANQCADKRGDERSCSSITTDYKEDQD